MRRRVTARQAASQRQSEQTRRWHSSWVPGSSGVAHAGSCLAPAPRLFGRWRRPRRASRASRRTRGRGTSRSRRRRPARRSRPRRRRRGPSRRADGLVAVVREDGLDIITPSSVPSSASMASRAAASRPTRQHAAVVEPRVRRDPFVGERPRNHHGVPQQRPR